MVFTEALFRKFLKTRAGIREGVPNTVLGFNASGTPEATLKSSLGGGSGNWEKVGDVTVSGSSVASVDVPFSRTVSLDGTDISKLVVICNTLLASNDELGYRFNGITTGQYSCFGNQLGANTYVPFNNTGNEITTGTLLTVGGYINSEIDIQGRGSSGVVFGYIKEHGGGENDLVNGSIGRLSVNTEMTAVSTFQLRTISGSAFINPTTRIIIYAVTLN